MASSPVPVPVPAPAQESLQVMILCRECRESTPHVKVSAGIPVLGLGPTYKCLRCGNVGIVYGIVEDGVKYSLR